MRTDEIVDDSVSEVETIIVFLRTNHELQGIK